MLQLQTSPPERVRVVGPLTGAVLLVLLDMVKTAEVRLDLSEVQEVDTGAVRVLAQLGPGVCDLLACPSWLGSRVESARRSQPSPAAVENLF